MLRFLKKHRKPKSPKTPVPPENATRQTTNISEEYGRDPELGEHRSRRISELILETDGADLTTTPDTNHGGGSRIAKQDGRNENQQFPAPDVSTLTPGHEGGDPSEYSIQ